MEEVPVGWMMLGVTSFEGLKTNLTGLAIFMITFRFNLYYNYKYRNYKNHDNPL